MGVGWGDLYWEGENGCGWWGMGWETICGATDRMEWGQKFVGCVRDERQKDGEGILQVAGWMDFWDFGARLNIGIEGTKKRGVTEEEWKQTRSFCLGHMSCLAYVVGRSVLVL